jgi:hypothetical protein
VLFVVASAVASPDGFALTMEDHGAVTGRDGGADGSVCSHGGEWSVGVGTVRWVGREAGREGRSVGTNVPGVPGNDGRLAARR